MQPLPLTIQALCVLMNVKFITILDTKFKAFESQIIWEVTEVKCKA